MLMFLVFPSRRRPIVLILDWTWSGMLLSSLIGSKIDSHNVAVLFRVRTMNLKRIEDFLKNMTWRTLSRACIVSSIYSANKAVVASVYTLMISHDKYSPLAIVEKIIISQEPLGRFINDICPESYQSMTKVDFDSLDCLTMKPLGIYGSRSQIVLWLLDKGVVSHDVYVCHLCCYCWELNWSF